MTTPLQEMIDGYFLCWNSRDADERSAAIAKTWTEEATSSDPLVVATGHEELNAMFAGAEVAYPGHTFRQVGTFDAHNTYVRWGWEMLNAEGDQVLDGIDVGVVAEDGRLAGVAGFFGAAMPAAVAA